MKIKRCDQCGKLIRHWNKSNLCYTCSNRKSIDKYQKMKKSEFEKMRKEVLRLREFEEAYHVLFEHFPLLDVDVKREITNNLNSVFILNDWEKIN